IASLAIGAVEASIEGARAHLALVVPFEQGAVAALVAPPALRLAGRTIEDHAVALDAVDIRAAQRVVDAAALRVGLGQYDPVASGLVDRSNMIAVFPDDFHMLADLAQ